MKRLNCFSGWLAARPTRRPPPDRPSTLSLATAAPTLAAAILGAALLLLGGCEAVSQSAPVKGGSYAVAAPLADFAETLAQGDNAQTASRLKREVRGYDAMGRLVTVARTSVELGTSRDPIITLKPAPAYGQYAVAVVGALALIGGAVLAFKAWPKIGGTVAAGGFVVLVIGLTSGAYGWAWALLAAGVCAAAVFALYSGYKSGLGNAGTSPPVAV